MKLRAAKQTGKVICELQNTSLNSLSLSLVDGPVRTEWLCTSKLTSLGIRTMPASLHAAKRLC